MSRTTEQHISNLYRMINQLASAGASSNVGDPFVWANGQQSAANEPGGPTALATWFSGGVLSMAKHDAEYWISSIDVGTDDIVFSITEEEDGGTPAVMGTITVNKVQLQDPYNIVEWAVAPEEDEYLWGSLKFTNTFQLAVPSLPLGTWTYQKDSLYYSEKNLSRFDFDLLPPDDTLQHVRQEMVLPVGSQNGVNTVFTCPRGYWLPESIIVYLNGVALPDEYVPYTTRTYQSFRLGGGIPIELIPNLNPLPPSTSDNALELRVSYDMRATADDGSISGDAVSWSIKKSRVEILTDIPAYATLNIVTSSAGASVEADTLFAFTDSAYKFYTDNRIGLYMNGRWMSKDKAEPYASGELYASGDIFYLSVSGDYYMVTETHYAGASPDWTKATASGEAADVIWVSASGIAFPDALEADDYIEIIMPFPEEV